MEYRTELASRGARIAHVNYDCPCSCVGGVIYRADAPQEEPSSCCCGRLLMVGSGAEARLRALLPPDLRYDVDLGTVTLPWGEQAETALAIPLDGDGGH